MQNNSRDYIHEMDSDTHGKFWKTPAYFEWNQDRIHIGKKFRLQKDKNLPASECRDADTNPKLMIQVSKVSFTETCFVTNLCPV
jgi:hypothetical protein